ncbi:DNA polymerase domain-containing protein [Thermococcus sp.]|uniref:DNA polymerase domain-containing protein n=1 Tax=Thermococcus sp. TaxID=35749 RepID=UPI00261D94EA|nr:DNA polymerase domain-containing protein [Thermococcus sp.]
MILDTDYITEDGRPVIRVFKKENGEFKIDYDRNFEPYIYALLRDDSAIEDIKKITAERHGTTVRVVRAEKVKKKFLGRPIEVWKLYFTHPQDVPAIRDRIRKHPAIVDIYEYDIPFAKRYLIDKGLIPMERDEELKMLAFDIETLYHEGEEFAEGPVLMISYASEEGVRVITWKKINLPYVDVVSTEKEMIKRFLKVVKEKDPDVLITYNGDNFDFAYLKKRCEKLGVNFTLGRDGSEPKIQRMGDRFAVEVKGRIHFDLYPVIRHTVNLPTYTLEAVYKAIFGQPKEKVYAEEIAQAWETGEGLERVARYSMEDAQVTYELGREFFPMEAQLSRLVGQSFWDVSRSSTGNLVEWFLLRKAYERNELAPNKPSNRELERRRGGYTGGYVKEPEKGLWENIAYLDYKALYPSIIITHNVSPDTLNREGCKEYDEAPQVGHRFCKDFPGFIPSLLGDLLEERQKIKKRMKATIDPLEKKLLDYRQRAIKILANSFYGYYAYAKARWYCKECAESVTAWGRGYIEMTMREIEEKFGFRVLYADSVTGDTEIIIRRRGRIEFVPIKNLFECVDYRVDEKEYCVLNGVEALTLDNRGRLVWERVPYVMRHKTDKRIYRIWFTNSWYLDVTEDHSLIGYLNTSKVKPGKPLKEHFVEVRPEELGDIVKSLITPNRPIARPIKANPIAVRLWELIGLLVGDGSWGGTSHWAKYYVGLSCGLDKSEIERKALKPLKEAGIISNYYDKNKKGDVSIFSKWLAGFMIKYFKDENGGKTIPSFMLNLPREYIEAFLRGLFSADGTVSLRREIPEIRLTSVNRELSDAVRKLLWLVGVSNSLFTETKPNRYLEKENGTHSTHVRIKNRHRFAERVGFLIDRKFTKLLENLGGHTTKKRTYKYDFDLVYPKKIEEIAHDGYVYDIEVEGTHRFFANGILVHNTDGFFATIPGADAETVKKKAKEFLDYINPRLPGLLELEYEGFYRRGFFVTKKKYAVIDEEGKITTRGLEIVRRDWSEIAKETQARVLEAILRHGDVEEAVRIVKEVTEKLSKYEVPPEKLVIHEQITRDLRDYKATGPHVAIAKRLAAKGVKIRPGTVISYIVLKGSGRIGDKAIPFDEFDPTKHRYDADYYIENQVLPAVERILKAFSYRKEDLRYQKMRQVGLGVWLKPKGER